MPSDKPLSNLKEPELIEQLKLNGLDKRKAEDQLFNQYSYFVQQGMHKYSISEDDALEVYSDTILSAIEKINGGHFEGRSSLKTYLFRIFHNKCVDHIRKITTNKNKIHRSATTPELLSHLSDSTKTIIQQLVERADLDFLKAKLAQLGDNCRQMLALFADGYSDREIALAMEYKTAEVVKTSRLRCLDKLRQSYNVLKN
jgi:RNA polymerase sigma-70 factor (ECF subfamily)